LNEATLDLTYKTILEATCLLVFFATPHQGGSFASFGEVLAKIVGTATSRPNNDLLKSLQANSDVAVQRFERSRHLYERFLFVSFHETEPYGKLGIVS
jgi:hypothetical protein